MSKMNEESSEPGLSTDATALAQQRTRLAFERTRIAAERTLMAWTRTSLSMISFGFTIYKFFQYLRQAQKVTVGRPYAPRNLGLTLIVLGTAALIVAAVQHWQSMQQLRSEGARFGWSLALIVAILVALVGVVVFIGVLLRAGPF